MQRQLAFKIITILLLIGLLLIPITMIYGLINERMSLRNKVVNEIAQSSALSQTITGPLIIVPYTKTYYVNNDKQYHQQRGTLYFFPESFNLTGDLNVEKRKRGIYEARLYQLNNEITGNFKIPENFGIESNLENYQFEQPIIAVGISDIRGISNNSKFIFNKQTLAINPGTENSKLGSGINGKLDSTSLQKGGDYSYAIQLSLQGTSSFNVSPIGKETNVTLTSNWPHPSFDGNFLPIKRDVAKKGFTADWQTNFFASDMESKFKDCLVKNNCHQFSNNNFGVSLIDPVDQYLKSSRAIKYAILFIGLTFFGFFLFEIIKRLAIHPIQYSFVGISLALFFLLLLSLSEHIGFALAYLCSAISCIAVIGFYVTSILNNIKQGLIFTVSLTLLYIMLYVLLNAEDYSLIMGTILVFSILSIAMIITRNLDWYKVASLPKVNKTHPLAKEETIND
ncbi:cell envelope integrity protein CreD [Entomomonas sp. E2T0]|uniref:cell envelope integrity protein CreD n=1 Tax=Entomomonas sp. E2T0 TaxID=2930213 RepID=UPI0022281572|nr:cell envelope integrity protein CreD [Entomomonas sp. E2T0]UYZ85507.1 cell envelope integrity protein CreD [Entomomonas sp. E2T0]